MAEENNSKPFPELPDESQDPIDKDAVARYLRWQKSGLTLREFIEQETKPATEGKEDKEE